MPPPVEIPLSLFGGYDSELAPPDVPEGVSPGNGDVAYLPGSVFTRPGTHKIYSSFGAEAVVYVKKYVQPNGAPLNLLFTSPGNLYKEDPVNSPGTFALLLATTPNSLCRSVTAFGREYIAISDGLHGTEEPLQFDGTYLDRVTCDGPGVCPTVTSVTIPSVSITGIARDTNGNVNVTTSAAHYLQVGYQVQLAGIPYSQIGGAISSIVINNENLPGIATVTTSSAHGLVPGNFVSLLLVGSVAVGGGIVSISRQGGIVSILTTSAHGLSPGASVTVSGSSVGSFNISFQVAQVPTSNSIICYQNDTTDTSATGGTLSLNWPLEANGVGVYFEVQSSPTATTFQVQLNYSDGTWTSGIVAMQWDGTFFVSAVTSSTSFQFLQAGPNITGSGAGTVTPYGQIAPGTHQVQLLFETRQGYITKGSPPIQFEAPGGQYLQITGIPTGPVNIVNRILAFTGADGADFFYLLLPPMANGQIVGTSTVISGNTGNTLGTYLDFSDDSLFAGIGITIPGNNLLAQVTLDGALGFTSYASRLRTWGQRNAVTNLLNMGFDGGSVNVSGHGTICGWQGSFTGGNSNLVTSRTNGWAWQSHTLSGAGAGPALSQSFYQDYLGIPIAQPNTYYTFRAYLSQTGAGTVQLVVTISSTAGGFSSSVTLTAPAGGGFVQGALPTPTPAVIQPDMTLTIIGVFSAGPGLDLLVDDMSLIYTQNPYRLGALVSYVNNPEGFDGETGVMDPSDDATPILNEFTIRDSLYLQTQVGLYETSDSPEAEPSNWLIRRVESDVSECGVISAFATDMGQGWAVWGSPTGLLGFAGGTPVKISQEVQTLWSQITLAPVSLWVKNDAINRRVYIGAPVATDVLPTVLYVMDYRENDLMSQIIAAAPVRISYTGRMISSDLGRKWSVWNLPMACCATLWQSGQDTLCFGSTTTGNVYFLDSTKKTDDDFGVKASYYITYGFVNHDQEQVLQLGSQRKLYTGVNAYVSGIGNVTVTPLVDSLVNARPSRPVQALSTSPTRDLAWGLNVAGERCFFKIAVTPLPNTTDADFNLQKLIVKMKKHPVSPSRTAVA